MLLQCLVDCEHFGQSSNSLLLPLYLTDGRTNALLLEKKVYLAIERSMSNPSSLIQRVLKYVRYIR